MLARVRRVSTASGRMASTTAGKMRSLGKTLHWAIGISLAARRGDGRRDANQVAQSHHLGFPQSDEGQEGGHAARQAVGAKAKDFAHVLLCNYRIVLLLFRRSMRRFFAPGFRDVLRSPAVAFTGPDRKPRVVKFWRHKSFCITGA